MVLLRFIAFYRFQLLFRVPQLQHVFEQRTRGRRRQMLQLLLAFLVHILLRSPELRPQREAARHKPMLLVIRQSASLSPDPNPSWSCITPHLPPESRVQASSSFNSNPSTPESVLAISSAHSTQPTARWFY